MVPIIIAVMTLAFVVAFLFPRLSVLLVWPVLFLYPQNYLFGFLPLNAGLDDIFILFVAARFAMVQGLGAVSPSSRFVVVIAVLVLLMQLVTDLGSLFAHPYLISRVLKDLLKNIVLLAFAWTMVSAIRTDEDVRKHIIAFGLAASLAGMIVVLSLYFPALTSAWEVRQRGLAYLEGTAGKRAFGPFNGPAEVAGFVCIVVPIAAGLLLQGRGSGRGVRLLAWAMVVIGTLSVLVSKTRSGLLGLAGMLVAILFTSRQRWYVLGISLALALVVGLAVLMAGGDVLQALEFRFSLESLSSDLATRLTIWSRIVSSPSWQSFLLGEGVAPLAIRLNATPHNGYLDALFVWGPFGVFVFGTMFYCMLKWSRTVMKWHADPLSRGLGAGVLWSAIAVLTMAMTSDPWFMPYYKIASFFMLALMAASYAAVTEPSAEAQWEMDLEASHLALD